MKPCHKAARPADLIAYLLAHRSGIRDCVIIDCLALDRLVRDNRPRRFTVSEVMAALDCLAHSYLSAKLRRIRQAGLVEYEAGISRDPGYQFLRIGPEQL